MHLKWRTVSKHIFLLDLQGIRAFILDTSNIKHTLKKLTNFYSGKNALQVSSNTRVSSRTFGRLNLLTCTCFFLSYEINCDSENSCYTNQNWYPGFHLARTGSDSENFGSGNTNQNWYATIEFTAFIDPFRS